MTQDSYTVTRTAAIEAPPSRIYDQVVDFHKWTFWSPWEEIDPDLKRTYSGAEAGTGAKYAWSGTRKAGQGWMEITDTTTPTRVAIDLVFKKPFKARNDTVFTIEPADGSGPTEGVRRTAHRSLAVGSWATVTGRPT